MRRRLYPWTVLAILTMLYTASFIDRQVLNLLVDPIRGSLGITDTAFSLLQGLGFMIAFVIFNPVAGWLVDRRDRRMLLLVAAVLWSLFTVACGLATSFALMFMARIGVGAAEAFVGPASWSLLADTFDHKRLPRALSIFLIGPYIGGGLALIFGGVLIGAAPGIAGAVPVMGGLEPWQIVFVTVGAPGIVLALLTLFVREPRRALGAARDHGPVHAKPLTLREALVFLWSERAFFVRYSLGMAAIIISLYSLPAWMPAVLIRTFAADPARVGIEFGTVTLVAGTSGVLAGPTLARLLETARFAGVTQVPVAAAGGLLLGAATLIAAPTYGAAMAAAALISFCYALPQAAASAALQIASPPGMRGLIAALYAFVVAIIGLVIAPTLVALITDHVFADSAAVHKSLSLVVAISAAAGLWLSLGARRHYRPFASAQPAEEGTVLGH